jgi:hypothetical protein
MTQPPDNGAQLSLFSLPIPPEAGAGLRHPCQFSPEILELLAALIVPGDYVFDPFAGPGTRLGALCDRLGASFAGCDIEDWPGRDPRVVRADAKDASSYPDGPFVIVTSPVYVNKRCADYRNGPTPTTKTKGRRDYGIALGRALDPENLARTTGRRSQVAAYWQGHADAVKHWRNRVILNVDEPIADGWRTLLEVDGGYTITDVFPVKTQRYGGLNNADKRAEHEVVMIAES